MRKYRIVEHSYPVRDSSKQPRDYYVPQVRVLFFWCNLNRDYWSPPYRTEKEAMDIILRHKAHKSEQFKIIHRS